MGKPRFFVGEFVLSNYKYRLGELLYIYNYVRGNTFPYHVLNKSKIIYSVRAKDIYSVDNINIILENFLLSPGSLKGIINSGKLMAAHPEQHTSPFPLVWSPPYR